MKRHGTRSAPADGAAGRERRTPAWAVALVLAALAIVLIAENTEEVRIRLVVPVVTMPLYLALLIMVVIGLLCGMFLMYGRYRGRGRR